MAEHRTNVMPSYSQCISDIYSSVQQFLVKHDGNYTFPNDFYRDLRRYAHFTSREVIAVCILSISLTLLRIVLTKAVFAPLASWLQMTAANQKKFPESAWKGGYYASMWGSLCYLLVYTRKYDYFFKPNDIWDDWTPHMEIPNDIHVIYLVQMSFYTSSLYTTVYMDSWRRDSLVMIFHHLVTIGLSVFSYATRYHKIGILAIFLHDSCDIFLEFTKINVYLKTRGGKYFDVHEKLSTVGFLGFAIVWFYSRLYLYPLKCLYSAGWASQNATVEGLQGEPLPFYLMYNGLLFIILALNLYWFMFIVNFVFKVLSGQLKEIEDTREDEVIEKMSNGNVNGAGANGHQAGEHGDHGSVSNGGCCPRLIKSRPKAD